jgi:hypothetical protein
MSFCIHIDNKYINSDFLNWSLNLLCQHEITNFRINISGFVVVSLRFLINPPVIKFGLLS